MEYPADTREEILARLLVLASEIVEPLGGKAVRNRLRIDDSLLPAIAILDGDETPSDSGYGRGRPANGPIIVSMSPEIYGFAQDGDDTGSTLNLLRRTLMKKVLNDEALLALCKDGDIRYGGYSTGFAAARSMSGEMGIAFAFVYVLRPAKL